MALRASLTNEKFYQKFWRSQILDALYPDLSIQFDGPKASFQTPTLAAPRTKTRTERPDQTRHGTRTEAREVSTNFFDH
jgi:hypothetical protein